MKHSKTDDLRKHAAYCRTVARMMGTPGAKKAFEQQAEKWLRLAERLEKSGDRKPNRDSFWLKSH